MTINYGIVSTAQVVPRFIDGVHRANAGHVLGITGRDLSKTQAFADQYDIEQVYLNLTDMLANPKIDIIYVATYNAGHYAAAKAALLAGKHVLVEKPFTLSYEEGLELIDLAKKQGLFLMEAQKSLFLPLTDQVKSLIQSGELGRILRIESTTAYDNMAHVPWFKDLAAGGGTVHFMAPYALSYLPYVLDSRIQNAKGFATLDKQGGADISASLLLQFDNQATASVYLTTERALPKVMTIIGTKGTMTIPEFWRSSRAEISYTNGRHQILEAPFESDFEYEAAHVKTLLDQGLPESPIMTPELTLSGLKIMSELYDSFRKGV